MNSTAQEARLHPLERLASAAFVWLLLGSLLLPLIPFWAGLLRLVVSVTICGVCLRRNQRLFATIVAGGVVALGVPLLWYFITLGAVQPASVAYRALLATYGLQIHVQPATYFLLLDAWLLVAGTLAGWREMSRWPRTVLILGLLLVALAHARPILGFSAAIQQPEHRDRIVWIEPLLRRLDGEQARLTAQPMPGDMPAGTTPAVGMAISPPADSPTASTGGVPVTKTPPDGNPTAAPLDPSAPAAPAETAEQIAARETAAREVAALEAAAREAELAERQRIRQAAIAERNAQLTALSERGRRGRAMLLAARRAEADQQERLIALEKQLAGARAYVGWVMVFLIPALVLARQRAGQEILQRTLLTAAFVQAGAIVGLHALADYSYILENTSFQDYFMRVRGGYYYHGPATLCVLLCLASGLGHLAALRRPVAVGGLILCALALWLNSTRAIMLGSIAAAGVLLLFKWRKPRWLLALVAFAMLCSTQLFYEKRETEVHSAKVSAQAAAEIARSNLPRFALVEAAFGRLRDVPWLGTGPGTQVLPLNGRHFAGELETNSSHALLPDLALQCGVPFAVLFLALFAWFAIRTGLLPAPAGPPDLDPRPPLLAALVAFALTSCFFPQENNQLLWLPWIWLTLVPLSFARPDSSPAATSFDMMPRTLRRATSVLTFALIGWLGATSPSYVVPWLEWLGRLDGDKVARSHDDVYTNSLAIATVGQVILDSLGDGRRVQILPDDPAQLPAAPAWVVWSPVSDRHYPHLQREWGFNIRRGYRLAPALRLPALWQEVSHWQTVVSLVRIGPWTHADIDPTDFGELAIDDYTTPLTEIPPGATNRPPVQFAFSAGSAVTLRLVPFQQRAPRALVFEVIANDRGALSLQNVTDGPLPPPVIINLRPLSKQRVVWPLPPRATEARVRLQSDVAISSLNLSVSDWLIRGQSAADPVEADDTTTPVWTLTDQKHATGWVGETPGRQGLTFDLQRASSPPILYRISGAAFRDNPGVSPISWVVSGSDDKEHWVPVDRREIGRLPAGPAQFQSFYLPTPAAYRWLRFDFAAPPGDARLSLSEIELLAGERATALEP